MSLLEYTWDVGRTLIKPPTISSNMYLLGDSVIGACFLYPPLIAISRYVLLSALIQLAKNRYCFRLSIILSSVVFLGRLMSSLYNLISLGRTIYTALYTKLALVKRLY